MPPGLAVWLAVASLSALGSVHCRQLAQATFQGNVSGLFVLEENTCYRAAIPLGTSAICSDPTCCYMACNDIWETSRCEYFCYCNSPDGCTLSDGDTVSMPLGTCLLSTNYNATADARRRRLAQSQTQSAAEQLGPIQSVQVLTGKEVPFAGGYTSRLAQLEPTLALNGPLSPLKGSWKKRGSSAAGSGAPAPAPAPAPSSSGRRRLLEVVGFESRYYRGREVLSRFNATSAEQCNSGCESSAQCAYWAWCPTDREEGCLLLEALNGTTRTVPPGVCTLSWDPTEGATSFLVMFGPGVTFFGGKWLPTDSSLVTSMAELGPQVDAVTCWEYDPVQGWQKDESQAYVATEVTQGPAYSQEFVQYICQEDRLASAAAFYEAMNGGAGSMALAAYLAAEQGQLSECGSAEGSMTVGYYNAGTNAFYNAAVDSFQFAEGTGNGTEALSYADKFIAAANAVGLPACVTVAVLAADGSLLMTTSKHT